MEFFKCLIAIICVIFSIFFLKMLNSEWFRPKKLEKILRQQGLNGNSYRLLQGDFKEMTLMIKEACSKPINLSDYVLPRVLPFIHKTVEKYGKNSFMWLGTKPTILIMDPDLMKEILVKHNNYQKPETNPLVALLAGGLAAYEEDKWAKHRKLINPAFQLEKLKHMLPSFHLTCMEMISKWEDKASSNGSYELDIRTHLQTLTSDVISRTAFGSNYEEGRKIFEMQSELGQYVLIAFRTVYIQGWRFVPTKRNKRMKELAKKIEASIESIVDKRIVAIKEGEDKSDDLLGILLESNFKEIEENGNKDFGMTIKEVIEECKLFYFAGQETTSVLLCWTMILLSKHQEWQQRAREEVLQKFGFEKPGYEELNHLKIVTMILYEVLRLFPPFPTLNRRTTKDTKLGKLSIPAGVNFQLQIMLLHYDREIWGDDAKEFKPERFSEGISKATKGTVAFYPFGWGPRICIGQNFTMLEAKMALALILQRFSFELSPSYAHAPYSTLTIQPQYGAHIILKKL